MSIIGMIIACALFSIPLEGEQAYLLESSADKDSPLLYGKNHIEPASLDELMLVNHVKASLEKAFRFESKLSKTNFASEDAVNIFPYDTPSDHLLNNLCSLSGASHLHVGLLRGGSFIAALYGNQDTLIAQLGLDWFQEYPKHLFIHNCCAYLDMKRCTIIDSGCFNVDKSLVAFPINIYFYDADHTEAGHFQAFTYYNDVFAHVFVAVVDDWKYSWIRSSSFKAFDQLHYHILYEGYIPACDRYGHGQYVVVIKKPYLN